MKKTKKPTCFATPQRDSLRDNPVEVMTVDCEKVANLRETKESFGEEGQEGMNRWKSVSRAS